MYAPLAIANDIVGRHPGRTTMGVCKLVYLVQGWSLAVGRPIVCGLPMVWKYGPVHASVYDAYRHFLREPARTPQPVPHGCTIPTIPESDAASRALVDQVVARYATFDDLGLSAIAHAPGSPWKTVAERHGFSVPLGTVVDEELILSHFTGLLNEGRERKAA